MLATQPISDESGQARVEIAYRSAPEGAVELLFELNAVGTEEMDKIVLDVLLEGLVLVDGSTQWSGFVPPRQPQHHRMSVKLLDSAEEPPVARVNVTHSRNSELLMQTVIEFDASDGALRPVVP